MSAYTKSSQQPITCNPADTLHRFRLTGSVYSQRSDMQVTAVTRPCMMHGLSSCMMSEPFACKAHRDGSASDGAADAAHLNLGILVPVNVGTVVVLVARLVLQTRVALGAALYLLAPVVDAPLLGGMGISLQRSRCTTRVSTISGWRSSLTKTWGDEISSHEWSRVLPVQGCVPEASLQQHPASTLRLTTMQMPKIPARWQEQRDRRERR